MLYYYDDPQDIKSKKYEIDLGTGVYKVQGISGKNFDSNKKCSEKYSLRTSSCYVYKK